MLRKALLPLLIVVAGCQPAAQVLKQKVDRHVGLAPGVETIDCPSDSTIPNIEQSCLWVTVHENHEDTQSRLISFMAIRFTPVQVEPSKSSAEQSIPVFDFGGGGPGASSGFSELSTPFSFEFYKNFSTELGKELILLEARGTGLSQPILRCNERAKKVAKYWQTIDQSGKQEQIDIGFYQQCRKTLTSQGIDLVNYNSVQVAKDADFIRRTLGIEKMHLVGVSYATRYAQTYARDFPEYTASLTLDSPVFTDIHNSERGDFDYRAFTTAFKQLAEEGEDAKALELEFYGLYERLNGSPISLSIEWPQELMSDFDLADWTYTEPNEQGLTTVYINGERFFNAMFLFLYYEDSHASIPLVLDEFRTGNFELFPYIISDAIYQDLDASYSVMNQYATYCYEEMPFADYSRFEQSLKGLPANLQQRSRQFTQDTLNICHVLHGPSEAPLLLSDNKEQDKNSVIDVLALRNKISYAYASEIEGLPFDITSPSLLLFGELDPVIPVEDIPRVSGNYKNGHILTIEQASHFTIQNDCVQQVIAGFIQDSKLSKQEKACLSQ